MNNRIKMVLAGILLMALAVFPASGDPALDGQPGGGGGDVAASFPTVLWGTDGQIGTYTAGGAGGSGGEGLISTASRVVESFYEPSNLDGHTGGWWDSDYNGSGGIGARGRIVIYINDPYK